MTRLPSSILTALAAILATRAVAAQPLSRASEPGRFAISISPTTVVRSGYKAVEIEARVTNTVTGGVGAGTLMGMPSGPSVTAETPEARMVHADVFGRYFFSGRPFDGWSLGLRTGLTRLPGESTHPGVGADIHRHWHLGPHVVGNVGWGLKRVFGGRGMAFDQRYVPWIKAHVGVAF